ncbi:MAG: IMPACT family protein [Thermaceae bacterium]
MPLTLREPVLYEEMVQRSRFIAKAAPVRSEEEALAFIRKNREEEAAHNPYAYKIGPLYRFSDDGEPAGTAGRPILHAIEALGLDHVGVLVVRYFGGVKLGAGGLVRAYGGVAAEALRRGEKEALLERRLLGFRLPYALAERAYRLASPVEVHHTPEGVDFLVEVEVSKLEAFKKALEEATRGQVEWKA